MGPSGSGKTTLLNLIGGLDRPTRGSVAVDGVDLGRLDDGRLADYRLRKVGFIFQFYNLIPALTALENVELPMSLAGVPKLERAERAKALLKTVGLESRTGHTPEELSGGEQQRVAVARALSNDPSVILGDEPTGRPGFEVGGGTHGADRLPAGRRQATFILVTHDPIVVARCDRSYSVRDGRIIRQIEKGEGDKLADNQRSMMDGLSIPAAPRGRSQRVATDE